jgi:hypothetical protein
MSETRPWRDAYVSRLCTFWIPRRFQEGENIDARTLVEQLNELISKRGFVMADGLIVTKPLDISPDREVYVAESRHSKELGGTMRLPISFGENFEIMVEPENDKDFSLPEKHVWGEAQQRFFGLGRPYQMGEDTERFGWSHLTGYWDILFFNEGERIVGVVHSTGDNRCFHCSCNEAKVVYTSLGRVVCMFCGATHLVLEEGLTSFHATGSLSAEEFGEVFGENGIFSDLHPSLPIIDFREFVDKKYIWMTPFWEAAKSEALFFLESSEEEIANYLSRTQVSPSMMIEMGWEEAPSRPSIAAQVSPETISLDLESNAQLCVEAGLTSFVRSSTDESALLDAILKLFQAIELLTKATLVSRDPTALQDRPNHPTVLSRLKKNGVIFTTGDLSTIERLRKLRNSTQHGKPSLNYLDGARVVREAIVFLHRFVLDEFNGWILDLCEAPTRLRLLKIKEIAQTADALLEDQKRRGFKPNQQFEACPLCKRDAITRFDPSEGARCLVCDYIPVRPDWDGQDPSS